MRKPGLLAGVGATLLTATVIGGLVWNEARKEIVYLCSNFRAGVTEQSVLRQLDTGQFLRYRREGLASSPRIVVDSLYNLGVYHCSIEFDPMARVITATVE